MKSFQQFCEQAAAVAPAPTPKPTPKVSDPSAGVDVDRYGRWQGNVVNLGKELQPGRTEVEPGRKGPDPNLPAGEANPNKKKKFDLEALKSKAPGTHTAAERQALLDAGLDDFVRGGKTQAKGVDAAGLGLAALGGAALGVTGAVSGLGGAALTQAGRLGNFVKGALPRLPKRVPARPAQPARYGGYDAAGKPNIPLKGEPGYRPPAPKTPRRGFDDKGNYIGQNYSRGRGMGDRW